MSDANPSRIVRAQDAAAAARAFNPPLNPESQVSGTQLAAMAGLKRLGVNLARVPPGKESFIYHRHHAEEEWVYILEGRGASDIEDEVAEVGPGDFIGYPPGVAHTLSNVGEVDLVYLMGGEQLSIEIAEFPRHGRLLLRIGPTADIVDSAARRRFWPPADEN